MAGEEEVSVSDATFKELYELPDSWWSKLVERSKAFDIFWCSPHLQLAEGGGSVKGEKQNS